jgi:hypothetical protein
LRSWGCRDRRSCQSGDQRTARFSIAIRVRRKLKSIDVIDMLADPFVERGVPGHIRSDNGPEFIAEAVQTWIAAVGSKTAYIAPGSP